VAQVDNLLSGARHADLIGLPLNRMVTVHWQAADIPLDKMTKATGRFTDLLTKALARHGSGTAWIWVHENAEGHDKGGHLHLLVHVPARLVRMVTGLQKRWLGSITGKPYRARVIHSRPIGGRLGLETANPDLHAINLDVALEYLLKGADEDAATKFNLKRLQPGGRIIGKRCGTSENIANKARKSACLIADDRATGSASRHLDAATRGARGNPLPPNNEPTGRETTFFEQVQAHARANFADWTKELQAWYTDIVQEGPNQ
jgi:hypothetical protein